MPTKLTIRYQKTPDLRETADAITRGRELVKQAQRLREQADRQIEGVQATLEEADRPSTARTSSSATRWRAIRLLPCGSPPEDAGA